MDEKTKKKVKKVAKKTGKKIIKKAKKNPKKFFVTVLIMVLILAIVIGCLYFFGPLKNFLPNNSEPSTSEPISSSSSESSSEQSSSEDQTPSKFVWKSVMEDYKADTLEQLDPDNGGLTSNDVTTITNVINEYYASVDTTYKGEALWSSLQKATAPKQLTSYGDLRYSNEDLDSRGKPRGIGGNPDVDYADEEKTMIVDFYSGLFVNREWNDGKNWNREHVWCQSHGWWGEASNSKRNGGTDLHHLRPEIPNINSSRNNSLYGEVSNKDKMAKYYNEKDGCKATKENGTIYGYLDDTIDPRVETSANEGVFEPLDRVKGDVARIVMYLLVRYKDVATPVTNIIYTEEGTVEACYELLLKWHESDPVSNFEIRRNQKTYEIQGNRNPFIDMPNYAYLIWDN